MVPVAHLSHHMAPRHHSELSLLLTSSSTIELKENTIIVVLGASGDLAKKKTVMPHRRVLLCSGHTNGLHSFQRYSGSYVAAIVQCHIL